jgi:hypothetical protein
VGFDVNTPNTGTWYVFNEGFLTVRSGDCSIDTAANVLYLTKKGVDDWGISLNAIRNAERSYINMDGDEGVLVQSWALNAAAGTISWSAKWGWVKL